MTGSRVRWVPLAIALLLAAGCGGGMGADVSAAGQQDYGTTKQMVVDILHSAEGRGAIAEALRDPSTKQKLALSEMDVAQALEKQLQSQKNQSFLAQQVKDPQFAATLAKSIQPELMQMQKQLLKDPQYQKDMLVLLKSPEFSQHLQGLMQTPEFRGQIMKVMTDALQTPSFRTQFEDALKRAVADSIQQMSGKSGQGQNQGGTGGSQGGGQGGR
ncbi:spore germination lipoprotein GerD [Alicyclobacillus macrosporangiidus]|uniref:spore germination lipoprotein GerD n=1 Tax=Alicyclobacillus macrosporangiidus TaxID=392015 RepID=UPI0009422E01|nr:spore germination lipoprotein GerD [Alicyclobacillus macrosporangiidus]